MKILEVSVVKILEVTALLFLASCALAERAGERIADGDRALTMVTAQREARTITTPLVERLDNLNFKMDLVAGALGRIENTQKTEHKEIEVIKSNIAKIQLELKGVRKTSKKVLVVNKKVLGLEKKILTIAKKLARISDGKNNIGPMRP